MDYTTLAPLTRIPFPACPREGARREVLRGDAPFSAVAPSPFKHHRSVLEAEGSPPEARGARRTGRALRTILRAESEGRPSSRPSRCTRHAGRSARDTYDPPAVVSRPGWPPHLGFRTGQVGAEFASRAIAATTCWHPAVPASSLRTCHAPHPAHLPGHGSPGASAFISDNSSSDSTKNALMAETWSSPTRNSCKPRRR